MRAVFSPTQATSKNLKLECDCWFKNLIQVAELVKRKT
jgi:hypothetical protein